MTTTAEKSTSKSYSFQAEVAQLLHLVTHSLYSNPEIFLRELVSNASDACDKLRFEGINNAVLFEDAPNLSVRVAFDKEAKTITITDNGIGLSQQEAIDNLGTIAKSGTRDFVSKLSGDQKSDAQLIGQFGVGFYSGFIVADKITVESRRAGEPITEGVRWTSGGTGDFDVVQPQYLEHAGPRDTGDTDQRVRAEYDRRQHHVGQRVPQRDEVQRQQSVDGDQASDDWGPRHEDIQLPWTRQERNPVVEEVQQDQTQPEHRHRQADQREEAHEVVDPAAVRHGRHDPHEETGDHPDEDRRRG